MDGTSRTRVTARRVLNGVLLCVVILVVVPAIANAKPMRAVIATMELLGDKDALEDPDELVLWVSENLVDVTARKYRQTPGWECLVPAWSNPGGIVDVSSALATLGEADRLELVLDLQIQVTLPGGKRLPPEAVTSSVPARPGSQKEDVLSAFESYFSSLVDNMARRGVKPCNFGLKTKGKTTVRAEVNWEATFEGETRLALAEDGSFSGTIPVSYAWSPMVVEGAGSCSFSAGRPDPFEVAGEFDDADGTLKFTRLQTHGLSGSITATCTVFGQTDTITMPVPQVAGVDVAAEYDVRIALQDGAQLSVPVRSSDPGITSEFTMDLTYEGEGTGAAGVATSES